MFDDSLPGVTWKLLQSTGAKAALVTLGAEGLVAFNPLPDAGQGSDQWASRLKGEHVPALCAHAVDSLGCGDALLAAATLALASGGSLLGAAFLGSLSAACQAQRLGNIVVSSSDLRQSVARVHTAQLAYSPSEAIQSRVVAGGMGRSGLVHGARAS
jgi:sugar/nucleoside kinase (ribokinase family)